LLEIAHALQLYPADPPWAGNAGHPDGVIGAPLCLEIRASELAPQISGAGRSCILESDDDRIERTTTEARAGASGQSVGTVLMASLVGAILLMIVIAAVTFR
jgi:hypothetical protein